MYLHPTITVSVPVNTFASDFTITLLSWYYFVEKQLHIVYILWAWCIYWSWSVWHFAFSLLLVLEPEPCTRRTGSKTSKWLVVPGKYGVYIGLLEQDEKGHTFPDHTLLLHMKCLVCHWCITFLNLLFQSNMFTHKLQVKVCHVSNATRLWVSLLQHSPQHRGEKPVPCHDPSVFVKLTLDLAQFYSNPNNKRLHG